MTNRKVLTTAIAMLLLLSLPSLGFASTDVFLCWTAQSSGSGPLLRVEIETDTGNAAYAAVFTSAGSRAMVALHAVIVPPDFYKEGSTAIAADAGDTIAVLLQDYNHQRIGGLVTATAPAKILANVCTDSLPDPPSPGGN